MNATKQGTAVIAILTLSLVACGQEEPIRFNRIPFDSNQLAPLLKTGSVVPIKRADFQQRLKSAADQIAPRDTITVDRAVYAANFGDQKLSGTFKLRLPKQKTADESKSDWVFLGKPNFDSLSLNAPSVWGRNASGDAIARRGESDSIEGTWSIEGKERQWGTEIVITPIMALATELNLTLPSTLRLETDGAFSSKGQPSATETTWSVILNERSPTRLRIVEPGRFMRPPIVDVRSSWSLRKDTTQLRAEINLQTSSSVTEFSIQLPTATTIESVLYGDNTPVPISVSDHSEGRRLKVTLPRPIEGPGRRLVLTARLPVVVDDKWTVPDFSTIRCSTTNNASVEAIARRITHSVFIAAPLELQELSLSGFKQSNNVFQEDGSQTLSLIRVFEDGAATLRIGEAKRTRRYHVATKLLTNQTSWEQKTLIISDTAFPREIRLRIPSNLTVFSVSSGPERTPCDFQIDPTSPQSARVFIPTTNNKVIEVIGQTDNLPTETVSPLDGITNTNLVVVSQDNLRLKDKSIRTVPLRQFRSDFGMYAGAGFAGPDTAIIECEPGEVVALKSEKRITVKPDSTEELTKPKELSTAIVSSMQLTSRIRNRPDADLHEARIEVSTNDSIVKFQLRKSAKIVSVSTNGIAQRPDRRGETVLVPINSATKTNLLVIRYSCSNGGESLLDTNRTIPVPKFNQARDFTWQIMSAPDLKVVSTHPFGQQPQQSEGLSQLLGPLRSATANEEPGVVTMPYVPQELSITLASKSSHQHMQWIALAGTALLSLLLVVRIKPIWLCGIEAVLALLSVVLPSPIGPICGSCFLGGLFGLAIANLFKSTSSNRVTRHSKSGLSRPSAVAGLLIIAAVATTANAFGQETTSELPRVYDIPDQDTVYVDRDFLKQLDRQEPAASNLLVQEAQYVVSIANGSIAVRARFEALQMHKNRSTIVRFPFARGNVSRCRLNGEAVDFDRTGEYVELTIPSTESTGPEPPTIIELELYPPMTNGGFRLPIAPAAKSTCEVQSEDAVESWLNGVVVEPNAITPVTTEIALELKSQNADTQDIPATISSDCAIEVGTSEVAFDHTVVITPGSNPVEDLTLRFPADQKFSSLVTDRPAIQQIVSTGSTTYAVISFREPLLVPTSIRLKLSKVMKSISTDRVLRLEPVVDGLSSVTVQSQPGLRIKNVRWMDNTDTNAVPIRTNNDRSAAFSIDTPGRMKFRIEAADAIRDLRLIQQVHIRETELEYELTGDMDITDGPVFSHTLNVSPDLRIESVMVRENDVDRLARYQREGDLLLLLLEGRTSGLQKVEVLGRVPLTLGQPIAIPQTRVLDARFQQSTLTLSRDEGLDVELLDNQGIPFAVRPDTAMTSSLESGTVTFELLETSEFPRVKVTRPTQLSVSAICFQRQDESGPLGWTWVYRLQGAKGISEAQVHPKGGRLETALPMQTDDQGLASISLSGDSNELVIIHYDTGDLTIPESEWKDASMQSRILALPKASSIRPENSRESEVALPAWASQFAKTEVILFDDDTAWNLVQRDETQPDTQSLTVRQIETILWHDKGIIAGKTTMALEPLPNGQLEVLLPQDVQVQSVEAGPRKLEFDMEQPTLLIPCPNIEQVTVRWTVASNNKTFSVPAPLMDAGEMLFAFLPGSPDTTIVSTEFAKITRDDYLANRFFTSDPPAEPAGLFLGRISSRMRPGQQLQIVSTSRSGPLAGIGLLCGVVVFAGSFSATQLRTRNRVPFILGGVALLLIVAGGSLWIVAGLILTATLLRWYLPHRM